MSLRSGFSRVARAHAKTADPAPHAPSRAAEARRALLEKITEFFTRHELAVTPANMATVCGALSGSQPEFASALVRREAAGEPIDQRWLDTLARLDADGHSHIAALETLSEKLEYTLERFAETARDAQAETHDHRGAIGEQVEALGASAELTQVIDLSRAMLARIEEVEAAMARSEAEVDRLRDNLAQARTEADVDHLTRLPNRRAFERRFAAAAAEARVAGTPLTVAFCDVDHFKLVNDRHGHAAGDRVLCALAASFAEMAGESCYTARHAGEEFVLLFAGLDKEAAHGRLDAIRRALAARVMMNRDTGLPFGKITFSGGVAEVTEDTDTRGALARADAALYRAKQQGRNRIEIG
jgi:diguanylate cyclase